MDFGAAGTASPGQTRHDRSRHRFGEAGGVCSEMVCPGEVGSVKAGPGRRGLVRCAEAHWGGFR